MRKIAEKSDWKTLEMPEQNETFIMERRFTDRQMQELRKGFIPAEMEDKWFCYMSGNTLFAHRSWTGFCIYIVEFSPDNHHKVTVNRNPEQYLGKSIDEDRDWLNRLGCFQHHFDFIILLTNTDGVVE